MVRLNVSFFSKAPGRTEIIMKERIYVVMHASVNHNSDKKNGLVDILYASKDIEKAKRFKENLSPYEVAAVYPMQLDEQMSYNEKPALSIQWDDLQ